MLSAILTADLIFEAFYRKFLFFLVALQTFFRALLRAHFSLLPPRHHGLYSAERIYRRDETMKGLIGPDQLLVSERFSEKGCPACYGLITGAFILVV